MSQLRSSNHDAKPDEFVITQQLSQRPTRPPEHQALSQALAILGRALADEPETVLQKVADTALALCHADMAGVSIPDPSAVEQIGHIVASLRNSDAPDSALAVGDCLSSLTWGYPSPTLITIPKGRCPQLSQASPFIEMLTLPFRIGSDLLGTVWATANDPEKKFDNEDVRVLESLSSFAAAAYRVTDNRESRILANERLAEANKLAEANAKFRTTFDQSANFAAILSLDGKIIDLNQLCYTVTGCRREQVIGKHFWECYWWQEFPGLAENIRNACELAARGETRRLETSFRCADGSIRHGDLVITPVRDDQGNFLFLCPTGVDLTEKNQKELELHKNSERMRLLWEVASLLLTTDNPDGMMHGLFEKLAPHFAFDTFLNYIMDETGESLRLEAFGGISDELIKSIQGRDFSKTICGRIAGTHEQFHGTYIQESDDPIYEWAKRDKLRGYFGYPLMTGNRLLGVLALASRTRDYFEPDELEFLRTICHYVTVAYDRLRLVSELKRADRKKDDFIAVLAHELRNPLAPIRNGLHVMQLAESDSRMMSRAREKMDRQLSHMVRLIDDLLDVSRITRNKMELRRERILLADVLNAGIEIARPLIDEAGHELTVSLPGEPIYVNADSTRLSQVLGNLLTNAAKYTAPGGHIQIVAKRVEGLVSVAVSDDGIGIPKEFLASIFDMFSQVDRRLDHKAGGLGIGLALVKGLVEMHGGTVTATSKGEGKGSTFTLTLPYDEEKQSATASKPDVSPPSSRVAQRILVVDDNRDGAESLADMLGLLGSEVRIANDGLSAIEAAASFRPEVILMDVGMPRMDGLEATERIRKEPWGKEMTIIALTGWGQDQDRVKTREAGCDAHLIKPLDYNALISLIEKR